MNNFKKIILLFLSVILIVPAASVPVKTSASEIISTVNLNVDFEAIALTLDSTEGDVSTRSTHGVNVSPIYLSVNQRNSGLYYMKNDTVYGIGDGSSDVESSRNYYLRICLQTGFADFSWPASVMSIPRFEHRLITALSGFTVYVNGSNRTDLYVEYNSYFDSPFILVPISITTVSQESLFGASAPPPANTIYNGYEHEPMLTITKNGKELVPWLHYKLLYSDNVGPGKAYVTAIGYGKYYGSIERFFTIYYLDVPGSHPYKDAVYWASEFNIAKGYTGDRKGYFGVSDNVTRGQVAMMLWRAAGQPEPVSSKKTFKDVPVSHSFYKAIQWTYEQGIAAGYSGSRKGYFGIADNCTRGQFMTFLWRFEGRPEPSGNTKTFSDVPVSHNFYKAIQWAWEEGIAAGYSNGTFGIGKSCTRGHCVTFMYRDMVKG